MSDPEPGVTPVATSGVRRRAASLVAFALALAAVLIVTLAAAEPWVLGRELWAIRASGWTAAVALALALAATPIARLAVRLARGAARRGLIATYAPALRRASGIAAAIAALAHAALSATTYLRPQLVLIWEWAHLRAGLVALVILALMLATSFPPIVRALRLRWWKELHRLGYVAALLVWLHLLGAAFASRPVVIAVFAALVLVGTLRALRPQSASASTSTSASAPSTSEDSPTGMS